MRIGVTLFCWFLTLTAVAQEEEQVRLEASARYEGTLPLEIALSAVRFSLRGEGVAWRKVAFQGVVLNDLQTDRTPWDALGQSLSGAWGTEQRRYNGVGVTQAYDFSPLGQSNAGRAVAAFSNRTYTYRLGAEYTFSKNNWGLGAQVWRRWGPSLTTDGVWSDVAGAMLSGERLSRDSSHRFRLTLVVNPMERAAGSPSTAEAFELAGNNRYNPAWGRWGDRRRSIRARAVFEPLLVASHRWNNLKTSLWVRGGSEARGGLTWQGAPNPMPDYWAALPSGQATAMLSGQLRTAWRANPEAYGQLRFDRMQAVNQNADRAHYMLESRVRSSIQGGVQSAFVAKSWSVGLQVAGAVSDNYRRAEDLLGGRYWLNVDQYIEMDDDVKELTQNDIRNPNAQIVAGDRYGYNYALNTFSGAVFGAWGHTLGAWRLGARGEWATRVDQRVGRYEKENFPSGRSYGASEPVVSWGGELSAHARWAGASRWSVDMEATYALKPPSSYAVFLSPTTRNAHSPAARPYSGLGFTATAAYRTPQFKSSFTAYVAGTWGEGRVEELYDDLQHTYVHFVMQGVATTRLGIEAWAEYTVAGDWSLSATAVASSRRYASNPSGQLFQQTTESIVTEHQTVHYDGLHLGGGPEMAAMLSARYAPYDWIAQLSVVGFMGNYATPAPTRRTFDALSKAATPQAMDAMMGQEDLGGAVTMEVFAGRTWTFEGRGGALGLYVGVSNLLNNQNIRSAGYESARLRRVGAGYEPHASKYYYAQGISFFVNLTYRF